MPTKSHSHNKHKKNKYYVSYKEDDKSAGASIMSGDSPTAHNRTHDLFEIKDSGGGRSSPTPTTSKDVAVQISSSAHEGGVKVVEASILVDPGKEKEDERNELSSPTLNNTSRDESKECDPEKTIVLEDLSYNGKNRDKDDKRREKKKLNGNIDRLDGVWLPKEQKKKQLEEDEEENCVVKCLYLTMQCCECSIM